MYKTNHTYLQIKLVFLSTHQNKLRFSSLFRTFLLVGLFLSLCVSQLSAKPTTDSDARKLVTGWLKAETQPLGMPLGQQIADIETFSDANDQPIYYVVYLKPSGFVIVSAEDQVEPIVGFSQSGKYNPSPDNPLGALVSQDLLNRIRAIRNLEKNIGTKSQTQKQFDKIADLQKSALKAQQKWAKLESFADRKKYGKISNLTAQDKKSRADIGPSDIQSTSPGSIVSDIRVEPLVQSKWGQSSVCGDYCYNYFTPNHYVCGCTATATAQLMRYHEHPTGVIGVYDNTIYVDGVPQTAYTRGGDGNGGPYNWELMVYIPDCETTDEQRQAIGALCYDIGVQVGMNYSSGGSSASLLSVAKILANILFQYENTIYQPYEWNYDMLNTNLDAGYPLLFDIRGSGAHAVVCDGYGFDLSTMYHHINMGWGGSSDAWYNLPDIISYNLIDSVVFNTFPTGTGEIISGRIADILENPINDVNVTAEYNSTQLSTTTNSKGIYYFAHVPSNTNFIVSASKDSLAFSGPIEVVTGYSTWPTETHLHGGIGNIWGADFEEISRPLIQVNQENFEFQVPDGQSTDSQILQISNAGYNTLNWEIIYDCNWLVVNPTQGISTDEINEVSLIVDTNNLQPGKYSCELTISDPCALNHPQNIIVDLFVGGIIYVPTDYPTIQDAIDVSVSGLGSEVVILPGTYTGQGNRDIDFRGKAVTVRSINPANSAVVASTIIDCQNSDTSFDSGFIFINEEDANSVLKGVTVRNASLYGILCNSGASPKIEKCEIRENNIGVSSYGANIYDCIVAENDGTGIKGTGSIIGCLISDNNSSGISCGYGYVLVENSLIANNTAPYGAGIYNSTRAPGELCIENCTIANNISYIEGGGIFSGYNTYVDKTVTISNSIVWDNIPEQIVVDNNSVKVSFSDVEDGWPGIGNINVDPCFVDPDNGDYHLQSNGWRWDSYQYVSCDFTGDEIVNLADFAEFAKSWLQSGQYFLADINKDEFVDLDDLYLFSQQYLTSGSETGGWTWDDITSRCIDAGNPGSRLHDEPMTLYMDPLNRWGKNIRINMGAYGGTAQASIAPPGWAVLPDINNDGVVNLCDFAHFASDWLDTSEAQPCDFNRTGTINLDDLIFLVNDWLETATWY